MTGPHPLSNRLPVTSTRLPVAGSKSPNPITITTIEHERRTREKMFRTALPENPLRIIALNRDVFFGIKLRNLAKELGYDLSLVPGVPQLATGLADHTATIALIVIDMNVLNQGVDWNALTIALEPHPDIPTLGFGSHTDVDERRSAK